MLAISLCLVSSAIASDCQCSTPYGIRGLGRRGLEPPNGGKRSGGDRPLASRLLGDCRFECVRHSDRRVLGIKLFDFLQVK